jgi:hypothetical protein
MGAFNAYAASLLAVVIVSSDAARATDRCDQAIDTVDRLTVERDRLFSKAPEDEPGRARLEQENERINEDMRSALSDGCKPGEVVLLSLKNLWLVREMCDFSKSLLNARDAVLCVMRQTD